MTRFDFCLAWNWEHDVDFVGILEKACRVRQLNLLQATPDNLAAVVEALEKNDLTFRAFLDRASEADRAYLPLVLWAFEHGAYRLNPQERTAHARNKASMHLEFITAGIQTPYTIILSPYDEQPHLGDVDISPLGPKFTIKPAHGGGGEGVVIEATSMAQVHAGRQAYPHDYCLLQAHIAPAQRGGRPAWFRVIACGGKIFPCWWDVNTHAYSPVTPQEESEHGLIPLSQTVRVIAGVCGLDIFSTEIALTEGGLFVAVDYVNDPIDLRLKSSTPDGVPDEIVEDIADELAGLVLAQVRRD